jgi:hypothetical protein
VKGAKQALLVMGSTMAMIVVALVSYFMLTYPNIISVILFVVLVPVFVILGLGFFKIAREDFRKSTEGA